MTESDGAARDVTRLTVELIRRGTALAAGLGAAAGLAPRDATGLRALDALADGPLPVGELRERVGGLSSAAATGLVDRLVTAGLVARRADDRDRRRVLVELTPAARRFGAEHLRPLAARIAAAIGEADERELAAVARFLRTVLADG